MRIKWEKGEKKGKEPLDLLPILPRLPKEYQASEEKTSILLAPKNGRKDVRILHRKRQSQGAFKIEHLLTKYNRFQT